MIRPSSNADLRIARIAQEAWIGEHHTAPWEPHPAPDLLLAQAFLQTKNIRLGPGGFLLPYHHPAELANRVAMLDPTDAELKRPGSGMECLLRELSKRGILSSRE